jgi:iron complex transport system ATP-binding protein
LNDNIIELKNIKAYINTTKVFENLTLEINKSSNTAILGPNGAGKTTLLKLLTREIYPAYRENSYIKLFGFDRWDIWKLRSHMGIVSHSLQQAYLGDASRIEIILSGYYASIGTWSHQHFTNEEIENAGEIMQMLGIYELKDRDYDNMSTGQQRRFLLGRALINNPDVLVFDEPTSGLDLKSCFQYLDITRKLMNDGKTIVLVTHHIQEIPPEISRVILLKNGEIIADGIKEDILSEKILRDLYEVKLKLIRENGFYQVLPG